MGANEIAHIGVKGRSGRYPLGSGDRPYQGYPGKRAARAARKAEKKAFRNDERSRKSDMRNAVKNRRQMSEEELVRRIERLQKEKKLRDLTNEEINEGREYTKDIMKKVGKVTVTAAATAGVAYAIRRGLGDSEVGKVDVGRMIWGLAKGKK